MPWSAKAQELLKHQYAPSRRLGFRRRKRQRGFESSARARSDVGELCERFQNRGEMLHQYREAYGHYCWMSRV
jgi:protein phosphatase